MGNLQQEQVAAGQDVGGESRELYVLSSASSPAHGGGGGGPSLRGSLALSLLSGKRHPAPANSVGQRCVCQSALILTRAASLLRPGTERDRPVPREAQPPLSLLHSGREGSSSSVLGLAEGSVSRAGLPGVCFWGVPGDLLLCTASGVL